MKIAGYDYIIYSDGGVAENGGAAAAAIVEAKGHDKGAVAGSKRHKIVCYLGEKNISAMEAEIFAGIVGLLCVQLLEKQVSASAPAGRAVLAVRAAPAARVLWRCDNKVVADAAEKFVAKWQSNSWKNARNKRVSYIKLWQDFLSVSRNIELNVCHVKSHSGNKQNEMCDKACSWVQDKGVKLLEQGEGRIGGQKNAANAWLLLDMSKGLSVNTLRKKLVTPRGFEPLLSP